MRNAKECYVDEPDEEDSAYDSEPSGRDERASAATSRLAGVSPLAAPPENPLPPSLASSRGAASERARPPELDTSALAPAAARAGGREQRARLHQWRVRERMRTSHAALVLCLNVGVDPPDVKKPKDCARTECWIDPLAQSSAQDALKSIGQNLQKQYERWQPRAKYKLVPDPTVADLRRTCANLRRNAKEERLLFHYNGHGVPKPTLNGEIWVFSRDYTQYIPLVLCDLQDIVGAPSLYVFDCNCAGLVVSQFLKFADGREQDMRRSADQTPPHSTQPAAKHHDSILLAACEADELLPTDPELPADLFTCCLTTPMKAHLRWFFQRSMVSGITVDMLDRIPGKLGDRATPLGELNWIFTAVTDAIAWHVLPRETFKRLFRQDLLLASVMRNFLLADRIMRSMGCTPVSYPVLPRTYDHQLWDVFDHTIEQLLVQLPGLTKQAESERARLAASEGMARADEFWDTYCDLYNRSISRETRTGRADSVDATAMPIPNAEGDDFMVRSVTAAPGISVTGFREANGVPASPFYVSGPAVRDQWLAPRLTSARDTVGTDRSLLPDPFSELDKPSRHEKVEEARLRWQHSFHAAKSADEYAKALEKETEFVFYSPISFFQGQMASFDVWLRLGPGCQSTPLQLPILLQVLLSQTFRVEALRLLSRYLQTGQEAVDLALSVGYFPYVLKLLESPIRELRQELVYIWGKIMSLDPSTCQDLAKEKNGVRFFAEFLDSKAPGDDTEPMPDPKPVYLVMAAFVLSSVARHSAEACRRAGVVQVCHRRLSHPASIVRRWSCLCMNEVFTHAESSRAEALASDCFIDALHERASFDSAADVRAAAVPALFTLMLDALPIVRVQDSSDLDLPSGSSGSAESNAELQGLHVFASAGGDPSDSHDTQFSLQEASPSETQSLSSSDSESPLPQMPVINLYHRVCSLLGVLARDDASALVRREAAIALSRIADSRPEMFRRGQQLCVNAARCGPGQSMSPSSPLTEVDMSCMQLFTGLRTLAFDPHPIVSRYAYLSLAHIVDDVLSPRGSYGGYAGQNSNENLFMARPDSHPFGLAGPDVEVLASHARTGSIDSFAPGIASSSRPPATHVHSHPVVPDSRPSPFLRDVGRQQGLAGEAAFADNPSISTPSFLHHLPPMGDSNGISCSSSGLRARELPAIGLGIADGTSSLPRAVHVRSASGSFNFAKVDEGFGSSGGTRDPSAIANFQGRANGVSRMRPPEGAMERRRSTGSGFPSHGPVEDTAGSVPRSLPLYPVALASGVGRLIRTVSQTFILGLRLGGTAPEGSGAEGDDSLSRLSSPSLFSSPSGGRAGTVDDVHGMMPVDEADLGPPRPRRVSSYQVLNKSASPPAHSSLRLPMPRTNSFLVGLSGSEHTFEGKSTSASRLGVSLMSGTGPVVDAARSLYAWSVDCIPLLVFDTNSADCMPDESTDVRAGYVKFGFKFGAPPTASDEELAETVLDSNLDTTAKDHDPNGGTRIRLLRSGKNAAIGGSVLSMTFIPKGVGHSGRSLVVTGDSRGGIGVYEVDTGKRQASLSVPGPSGMESSAISDVLSLNSPVSPSTAIAGDHMYEAAMILGGSVDGRVAIFKSDLESSTREGRYSIVSTFQASGVAAEGDKLGRVLPLGSLAVRQCLRPDGLQDVSPLENASTSVRSAGIGLTLAFEHSTGRLFAGGCQAGVVREWDLIREYAVSSLNLFDNESLIVTKLAGFSVGRPYLCAYGGSDGTVGWIDWRSSTASLPSSSSILGKHRYSVGSLCTCVTGLEGVGGGVYDMVVSADLGGDVNIWDLRVNAIPVIQIRAHSGSMLTAMAMHPSSRTIVTAGTDNLVKTFGPNFQTTGVILPTGEGPQVQRASPVTALALQRDLLAVGCADSAVMLYERNF